MLVGHDEKSKGWRGRIRWRIVKPMLMGKRKKKAKDLLEPEGGSA